MNILDTEARMPQSTRRRCLGGAAAATAALAWPALAQPAYPNRPVRLIVPFPAGGPIDTIGRAVAHKLSLLWGQQAIIHNPAGAEGAARAVPDGSPLLVCSIHHTVLPSLRPRLSYDIERDFVPLTFGTMF